MITDQYLKTALQTAEEAGKIFSKNFGRPKNVINKQGQKRNFVTEVDLQIEKFIRNKILSAFPDHKIIGEEMGRDRIGENDMVWIIDPIDGTANFIHGLPYCCISIALWDSQGPLVGVVYSPVLGKLYSAARGKGAFLNGKKITISENNKKLSDSFGGIGWGRDMSLAAKILPPLLKQTNKARVLGSAALEICEVACGVFDFYVHFKINIWDAAAGILIVQEAGGKVTDWQGNRLTYDLVNLIADNEYLHKELIEKIKKL